MDLDRTQVNTPGCPAQGRCGFPNFSTTSLWIFRKETLSVMKGEWKTVRSKASFHVWIYLSQDSLQQPKAKHSVFSSALPSTKRREQPCGLGHSQAINLVAKSLMYWCWWTSKPACCSLYHPLSFSQTLSLSSLGSTSVWLKENVPALIPWSCSVRRLGLTHPGATPWFKALFELIWLTFD